MRMTIIATTLAVVSFLGSAANAALLGLNNTGGAGWTLPTAPGGALTTVTTTNSAWGTLPGADWFSTSSNSQLNSSLVGDYTFRTSFDLSGSGAVSATLAFDMLYDNSIVVMLTTTSGTVTLYNSLAASNFSTPATSVAVTSSLINLAGLNTLDFIVTNAVQPSGVFGVNPVGLNVNFTTQEFSVFVPVPEPSSIALWGGLCGLGMVIRRRFKRNAYVS